MDNWYLFLWKYTHEGLGYTSIIQSLKVKLIVNLPEGPVAPLRPLGPACPISPFTPASPFGP